MTSLLVLLCYFDDMPPVNVLSTPLLRVGARTAG